MLGEFTILDLIKDLYPLSFIGIVNISLGYVAGVINSKIRIKHVDNRIEQLEKRLNKTH